MKKIVCLFVTILTVIMVSFFCVPADGDLDYLVVYGNAEEFGTVFSALNPSLTEEQATAIFKQSLFGENGRLYLIYGKIQSSSKEIFTVESWDVKANENHMAINPTNQPRCVDQTMGALKSKLEETSTNIANSQTYCFPGSDDPSSMTYADSSEGAKEICNSIMQDNETFPTKIGKNPCCDLQIYEDKKTEIEAKIAAATEHSFVCMIWDLPEVSIFSNPNINDASEIIIKYYSESNPQKEIWGTVYLSQKKDFSELASKGILEFAEVTIDQLKDSDEAVAAELQNQLNAALQSDKDGDGIPAKDDNCLTVANEDQLDTDGDGFGDACDYDDNGDMIPEDMPDDPANPNNSPYKGNGSYFTPDPARGKGGCSLISAARFNPGSLFAIFTILIGIVSVTIRRKD